MSIQNQTATLNQDTQNESCPFEDGENYRYKRLNLRMFLDDMKFSKRAPVAGDVFPTFNLVTSEGKKLTNSNVFDSHTFGEKPVMFVFGSMTCPMTLSSMPRMDELQHEFGDKIEFVLVQGREAHPGENTPQPETMDEKQQHAQYMKEYFSIGWTVATDNIDGTLHRALDPKPNPVYLVDSTGKVLFRSIWAGDVNAIRQTLEDVIAGKTLRKKQSVAMIGPMSKAMGHVDSTIKRGGKLAVRDMWRVAPPVILAGRIANLFSSLSPDKRGIASVVTMALGFTAVSLLVVSAFV